MIVFAGQTTLKIHVSFCSSHKCKSNYKTYNDCIAHFWIPGTLVTKS